jgi:hypothetical protein
VDVTLERQRVKHCLDENRAGVLKEVLNEYFYPVMKCPWGCMEYYTKCGSVPFDNVLR